MAPLEPCTFYVQEIGIYPEAQGQRYGVKLMERARQTALAYGCQQMALDVEATNAHAIHIWQRFGFEITRSYKTLHRMTLKISVN